MVWHSMLTQDDESGLERVQKCAVKIILPDSQHNYQYNLTKLGLSTLKNRREQLCLNFAKKCLKNSKMKDLFYNNKSIHEMKIRNKEQYNVEFANTKRLKNSPIIYMQRLLNEDKV